jgi:hypothetical protein
MTLTIAFLLISLAAFFVGGLMRGMFECVIIFDSMKDFYGSWWSYKLFKDNKDRNNDGEISFLERNFPNDGGHRAKLAELLLYAYGGVCYAIAFFSASFELMILADYWIYLIGFVSVITIWWVMSIGFLTSFKKYRHGKKTAKFNH